jgi:hypothetical protein
MNVPTLKYVGKLTFNVVPAVKRGTAREPGTPVRLENSGRMPLACVIGGWPATSLTAMRESLPSSSR